MRSGWWSTSALVLALTAVATAAAADDEENPVAIFRSRVVDLASDTDIRRLRDDLLERGAGAFSAGVFTSQSYAPTRGYRGRLRSLLAASLTDGQVVAELRAAREHPDEPTDRLDALLVNLRGRRGLGAVVVEAGVVGVAARAAEREPPKGLLDSLCAVARDDLLFESDPRLAKAIMSVPLLVAAGAAEELADEDHHAAGLRFVADVLCHAIEVPERAREALAGFDVNLGDIRQQRPLGAERRARLVRVAREDPDPALRTMAAHVLHFANTWDGIANAYEATAYARSHRVDLDEWNWLGRTALPPVDAPLPPALRARAAGAWMYFSHVGAKEDPDSTERMAAELRAFYHELGDDRAKGALVRTLEGLEYRFVDTNRIGRPLIVPSFAALLDDWERGSDGAGPSLRALERHVAELLRTVMLRGDPLDRRGTFRREESPVAALIPERPPTADERVTTISRWLRVDPAHLHDMRVRERLAGWGRDELSALLEAYPEDALRSMLTDAPTRESDGGHDSYPRHDASGSLARQPLLDFLLADPRHAARLTDTTLWSTWSDVDRRHAGAQLHRLLHTGTALSDASVLADDAFALGFVADAFESASGPVPADPALAFAARVMTGNAARPELRARIADSDAGDEHVTFLHGLSVDVATIAELRRTLAEDADPRASIVVARLLAATGQGDALDAVFSADTWLAWGTEFSSSTWIDDVAYLVRDDETRNAVLRYVARPSGLPRERVDAFEALAGLGWVDELFDDDAPAEAKIARLEREIRVLGSWMRSSFARLDPDVAEGVVEAWLALPIQDLPEGRSETVDIWAAETLVAALESFPDGGPKRRMRAELAESRDAE